VNLKITARISGGSYVYFVLNGEGNIQLILEYKITLLVRLKDNLSK